MLTNPTAGRRLSGRLMVCSPSGVALPLTATRAINYVDVPMLRRWTPSRRGSRAGGSSGCGAAAHPVSRVSATASTSGR